MFLIQICFLILIKSILIHSEVFTSTTHLSLLLETEIALAKNLETFLKQEYERLDHIEKFVNVIKDEIHQAEGNEEYYFGNPVNSYLIIKHLTADLDNIEEMLPTDFINNLTDNWLFPSFEDYNGSAVGLMRLQHTYELNASYLANGEISSKFKSKRLSALECYELGRIAYANKDFYYTLMWMQEALDHLNTETDNTSINKIDILDHLAHATFQQGNIEHALKIIEEMLTVDPNHVHAKDKKILYETAIKNRTLTEQQQKDDMDDSSNPKVISPTKMDKKNQQSDNAMKKDRVYEKLCRQNGTQLDPKRQAKLFCRYRHNNHPYLILQPVKEEQILDEPTIYLFHDVISNSDIEEIKSLALPNLERSGVRRNDGSRRLSNNRVSKSAWLTDEDSPVVARLSRLIEAVTNLSLETAEKLQIANYGVGGYYAPHFDFLKKTAKGVVSNSNNGDRIATWLTYLSDVEQGGATVFPEVDAHLKPKKGSAAFWYNLYASGDQDHDTLHSGCPVLIGNKWIANKWIHEHGQEFRRPCSLDPMA